MSNSTGQGFAMIIALFTAVLGLCCLIIGLSGGLSGEEMELWIRLVLLALALSGGLMIYGGITMFFGAKKKIEDIARDEKELAKAIKQTVKQPVNIQDALQSVKQEAAKPFAEKNTLLAHWNYNAEEWNTFTKQEFRYRVREAIILWVLITGLGTLLIAGYNDMGHLAAFISSISVGGLLTGIRLIIANNARKANTSKPGDVVISAKSILINGKYHTLNDENKTLSKLELLKDETPQIIEFTVVWNTRRGPTNEQIRVPIPAGKEDVAAKIVCVFYDEIIGKY